MTALAMYLCGIGHMSLVVHERCEHGESVHASDTNAHPSSEADADSESAVSAEAAEGHDHCQSSGVVPALACVTPSCAPSTLIDAALLPRRVGPAAAVRALSILSQAPKSSPPV